MSIAAYVEDNASRMPRTPLQDEPLLAKPIRLVDDSKWLSQLGRFRVESGQAEPRRKG